MARFRDYSYEQTVMLPAPLRRRFMAHLEAEGHPAIRDGRLVNEGQELDSDDGDYHAANVSGRPGALKRWARQMTGVHTCRG